MLVRSYDADRDAAATLAVFVAAVRGTSTAHYDPAQVAAWSDVDGDRWAADRARHATLVAADRGRIVGVVDVDAKGWIDVLFVDPAAGRRGVGGQLLTEIGQVAVGLGVGGLRAHASITARPVFERAGFVVVRERRPQVRGQRFRNFEMVRWRDHRRAADP